VSVETVDRAIEVAALVAVILAPTTAAPEVSRTVPVTLAVCARRMDGATRIPRIIKKVSELLKRRRGKFMPFPFGC
jgi:hypothetical protein